MKTAGSVFLICILTAMLLCGCAVHTDAQSDRSDSASSPSEPAVSPFTTSYDTAAKTLYISGTQDYPSLSIPTEIREARVLEVSDDDFSLSIYLPVLRDAGWDLPTELSGFIDRTDQSLRFLREYLYAHATSAYPSEAAEKPVAIRIDRLELGYRTEENRVVLRINDSVIHREFLYLLSLMDSDSVGWEQIGYAWYVGTCIDPFSEALTEPIIPADTPYYRVGIDAGVDSTQMTAADMRTMYDAVSRICFDRGLTHWGSFCESSPVSSASVFTRTNAAPPVPGDETLSAFMAASFLAWLDDAFGFAQVSLFCFGQQSFEEAFGTDFDSAFDDWNAWIIRNYPAE